jgi:hypothetical protein
LYKMYNSVSDYKKLLFLLIILGQVWNKNINNKFNKTISIGLKKKNPKIKIKTN